MHEPQRATYLSYDRLGDTVSLAAAPGCRLWASVTPWLFRDGFMKCHQTTRWQQSPNLPEFGRDFPKDDIAREVVFEITSH
jgi:hypothetical protein